MVRDLLFVARIVDAAARAGVDVKRVDSPSDLPDPADVDVVLVDWADRAADLGTELRAWRDRANGTATGAGGGAAPRVILFGSHVDLTAHAEARRHGLGPVMARSAFVQRLPQIVRQRR